MISDLQGQIWLDGTFCDWKDAKIHILTHTLHYGTGVFEGVRAYETEQGPAILDFKIILLDYSNLLSLSV